MRILRADIIHHLCKKPLADVTSLHLQGRGVEQLEGLGSCPSLTSLDVSYNSLTGLDEECFARCRELWVLDASHNQLVSSMVQPRRRFPGSCCDIVVAITFGSPGVSLPYQT